MAYIKNFRGKERWLATAHVTLPDGRVVRREKLFPDAKIETRRKAERWELKKREEILEEERNKPVETPTECLDVGKWVESYLNDVNRLGMADKTYYEKRMAFVRFAEHKGVGQEVPIESVDRFLAKAHLDRLIDAGRTGNAVNRDRKNLGSAWAWGIENMKGWPIGENPFLAVKRYKEKESLRYVPSETDFWKVTDYLKGLHETGEPRHVQDYTMHMAFLHLAARRGEIFRMKVGDLDFEGDMIRLWTRKRAGGKLESDTIPMTSDLKSLLLRWLEIKMGLGIRSDYVFVYTEQNPAEFYGCPFKTRQHYMKKTCKRAKVKPFGFHAIRHFTASYLFHQGQSVSVIQKVLRHKNPNTTTRYLRSLGFETETVRDALEEIGRRKAEVIPLEKRSAK